jgi:hypothetical protein
LSSLTMMASSWVDCGSEKAPGNSRDCTALAGVTCSTTELRSVRVRKESNLRHCDDEVTALFTTGTRITIRERAIAETPAAVACGPGGRFKDEVTAIFTTDRERVGGEQSMLLPLPKSND